MKIIYLHHGNRKIGNPPSQNDDLTEIGYKDCNLVAELFDDRIIKDHIKAIYTSPYFRCRKTAEIINGPLQTKIIEDERLNEFDNKSETWTQLQTRVIACLDDIVEKYDENDIVICVTSGVNIAGFIIKAFNLQPSQDTPFLGLPNCCPIIFNFKK